ncbi:MAG TPA: hypothetical protein VN921_03855 [Chthoniobacterales bacterium]|nr:hypothetical protein [Chthoniobacterales bacterium]
MKFVIGTMFKRPALLLAVALPLGPVLADDLPKPLNFARYQAMIEHSPFAIATAVAPPPSAPNFAKDLFIANAARSKDGDMVTIASSADKNFKKYLTTKEPEDGYSISSIEWSDKIGATKVTITKDGQFATLSFNEALLRQPLAQGQAQPPVMQQPQPQFNQQVIPAPMSPPLPNAPAMSYPRPMPVPSLPTPPPRVRGVIPRNPTPAVQAPTPQVEQL